MKKYILFFVLLLTLTLSSCSNTSSDTKDPLKEFISWHEQQIPETITPSNQFKFDSVYEHNGKLFTIAYSSDDEYVFSNIGELYFHEDSSCVNVTFVYSLDDKSITKCKTIYVEAATTQEILEDCANKYIITSVETSRYSLNYTLPARINYSDIKIKCSWSSNKPEIISSNGIFNYPSKETDVTITGTFTYNNDSFNKDYIINTKPLDKTEFDLALSNINIPKEIEENINLQSSITVAEVNYPIIWTSNRVNVITNNGELMFVSENTNVILTAEITVSGQKVSKDFNIIAKPISGLAAIEAIEDSITVPAIISNDVLLPSSMQGVTISWTSSDTNTLSNDGIINKNNTSFKAITLTTALKAGSATKTLEFHTQVAYQSHMFLDRTFEGEKIDTVIDGTKLVLADGKLTGTYTTKIIECANFKECVGSYSATSSTTEICELKVRIRINNTWSKYFTYGEFGKGLENGYSNQTSTNSKMVEDEISVTSGAANAFQLQLVLKRNSLNDKGPIVSLLALSIDYSTHNYSVDITNVPKEYKHDVPKLYQHVVPTIGGSICSITSSTMLMMYRGYSFDGLATYPHQYMAGILRDYGHGIYGNWSYNCIGMGSFGAISYVKRFYSYNEIIHHLYYVGPVAASIKGTFVTDAKTYTTNGHLIVITGYKIENNQTYFYINDPNIQVVSTRCTLQSLENVNRMVSYVIE